jgi:addiction module HigA family antidote
MATFKFVPPVAFHPGETLSEKLKEMGMSVKEFAIRTSKPEKTIFAIIKGNSSITSDMAVAFEIVTRIPAHFWLKKQRSYDEYMARVRREAIIEEAHDWAEKFPYAKMVELGWVEPCENLSDKVQALFNFFQVSTVKAWQDYYCDQQLKVAFSISLNNLTDPYAISAWLRQGERQAEEMSVESFSVKQLKSAIPEMKLIMANESSDFADRLQSLCAKVGIKLVYTPSLPKASINGSTRRINDIPCIQLTNCEGKYDLFWLTFFHEIGHILLHGKKDVFLENIEFASKEKIKEKEADEFAAKILLTSKEEAEIVAANDYSEDNIILFAKKFGTHSSIIVRRLQRNKVISEQACSNLLKKFDLFK